MAYRIVHCSIDENKKISGGKAGDQTGKETCERDFYDKGWGLTLRYKDSNIASQAAILAIKLAKSNLVGYDQSNRNSLYKELEKVNFDVDRYIKTGIKTEADCSAYLYAVWSCLIKEIRGQSNAPTTSTAESFYSKFGFKVYKDSKYYKTGDYNLPGDMINKPGSHIIMFTGTGKEVTKPNNLQTIENIAKSVLEGKYGNGEERKAKLEAEGYNYKEVQDYINKNIAPKPAKEIKAGLEIKLENTRCYTSSASTSEYCKKTGKYYVWSDKVVNNRVMITNSAVNVGKKDKITCWVNKADITK